MKTSLDPGIALAEAAIRKGTLKPVTADQQAQIDGALALGIKPVTLTPRMVGRANVELAAINPDTGKKDVYVQETGDLTVTRSFFAGSVDAKIGRGPDVGKIYRRFTQCTLDNTDPSKRLTTVAGQLDTDLDAKLAKLPGEVADKFRELMNAGYYGDLEIYSMPYGQGKGFVYVIQASLDGGESQAPKGTPSQSNFFFGNKGGSMGLPVNLP
jgi:hypothetical protein